jgi:tryptophan synthase alpha chain
MRAGAEFHPAATPTTDEKRLPAVLANTSGFVITFPSPGSPARRTGFDAVAAAVDRIRMHTDLPVAVGFGVKTPEQAAAIGRNADAVVVGSALVSAVASAWTKATGRRPRTVEAVTELVGALAQGVRASRLMAAE